MKKTVIEHYSVAIRKKSGFFADETGYKFEEIIFPFSDRYWAADPFIIEKNNEVFLFYELFDNCYRKGSIAYSVLNGNAASKPTVVIEKDYHFSFPFLFEWNNRIYMIPETNASNKIELYVAEEFPKKWTYVKSLVDDIRACDSILYYDNDELYLMTSEMDSTLSHYCWCYVRNKIYKAANTLDFTCVNSDWKTGDFGIRNGGNVFLHNNHLMRVGQDCTGNQYGKGLVFWEDGCSANEKMYKAVSCDEIEQAVIWHDKKHMRIKGCHTYNCSEHYEVIDCSEKREISIVTRIIYKAMRIMRKLLHSFPV